MATRFHKLITCIILVIISTFALDLSSFAQSVPTGFNYQAVARDKNGWPLVVENIVVEITVRSGSETGPIVWQEGHDIWTNEFGLFNLVIGEGITTGLGSLMSFKQIPWGSNDYFLKVRVDFGNGLLDMGVVKLLSVPYARMADSALYCASTQGVSTDSIITTLIQTKSFQLITGANYGYVLTSDNVGNASWQPAAGDVTGLFHDLKVERLQGYGISTLAPTDGQILQWNNGTSSWEPTTPSFAPTLTGGTGIIITNDTINADIGSALWNANKLQGYDISSSIVPVFDNYVLSWDSVNLKWRPAPLATGTYIPTTYVADTGLLLTGNVFSAQISQPIWNANQLYGTAISSGLNPGTGQVLSWNGTAWDTATISVSSGGAAYTAGTGITIINDTINASANSAIWNANSIQNTPVISTSPKKDEILGFDGTNWIPMPPKSGGIIPDSALIAGVGISIDTSMNTISALTSTPLWNANQLYGTAITSGLSPSVGQVLSWNGAAWDTSSISATGYTAGTGLSLSGNTFNAQTTTALWNAIQISGSDIAANLSPNTGQVLSWTGTVWDTTTISATAYTAGTGITINTDTINANASSAIWNANNIQSIPVSTTSPNKDEILGYDGTNWIPMVPKSAVIVPDSALVPGAGISIDTSTSTISALTTDPLWNANQLYGTAIDTNLNPGTGQFLSWNGVAWDTASITASSYNAGTGLLLSGNTFNAQTNSALWNANQLSGTPIAPVLIPTTGQVLSWDGTAWDTASISGTGYTAGTGMTLSGNTFNAQTTTALWNANQLSGTAISPILFPTTGQVLSWDGTAWDTASISGTGYTAGTGLSLSGNTFNAQTTTALWNANQLSGKPIASVLNPISGQVLSWDGTAWDTATISSAAYTAGSGISISGSIINADSNSAIWNANMLRGLPIQSGITPSNGNLLKWSTGNNQWETNTDDNTTYTAGTGLNLVGTQFSISLIGGNGITINGNTIDADALTAMWNANKLQNNDVSTAVPASGEVLKWNGTAWTPASDLGTTYTGGNGIDITGTLVSAKLGAGLEFDGSNNIATILSGGTGITITNDTVISATATTAMWNANQLYGTAINSSLSPSDGDVLKWNNVSAEWEAGTDNTGSYIAGNGIDITGSTISATLGTGLQFDGSNQIAIALIGGTGVSISGSTINADSNSAIWNANQLYGTPIQSGFALSNGNILKWSSGNNQWETSTDANTTYTAGTGLNLIGTQFSINLTGGSGITITGNNIDADVLTALWNANQLQGEPITTTTPTNRQLLIYNGTNWSPGDAGALLDAGDGIDITSNTIDVDITDFLGKGVSDDGTNNIDVNYGTTAETAVEGNQTATITAGNGLSGGISGDALGDGFSATLDVDYGTTANSAVEGNQTATITAGTGLTGGISADALGDGFLAILNADNTNAIWNANQLQGEGITTVAPANGQILTYNGTNWTPAFAGSLLVAGDGTDITGNTIDVDVTDLLGTGLDEDASNNIIVKYGITGGTAVEGDQTATIIAGTGLSGGISADVLGDGFIATLNADNNNAIWNANQLQGENITTTTPTNRQLLIYNGTNWSPGDAGSLLDAGDGIDITGNTIDVDITDFLGIGISDDGTNNIDVDYGTTAGTAVRGDQTATITAGNGLSGGISGDALGDGFSTTLDVDYGITANTAVEGDQTATINAGIGLTGGISNDALGNGFSVTLDADNTNAIWNANELQGVGITTTAPANGQLLGYNGSNWTPGSAASFLIAGDGIDITNNTIDVDVTDLLGTGIDEDASNNLVVKYGLTSGTAVQGNQTATIIAGTGLSGGISADVLGNGFTATLNADSNNAIWNANKLQGEAITTTTPTNRQLLIYNGTNWAPGDAGSLLDAGDGIDITGNTIDVDITDFLGIGVEDDGSNNIDVKYGIGIGTAVQGFLTATITAGDGLSGGISGDALGDGFIAVLDVDYGISAKTAVEGNQTATITAGTGITGGISGDALGDGFSTILNAQTGSPIWNANQLYGKAIESGIAPVNGEVLKWSTANNQWEAATDLGIPYGAGDGISITANTINVDVTDFAGAGLSSSANDLLVDFAGTGSATTVSRSDHSHQTLTSGVGLSGSNYNGSANVTWAVDFLASGGTSTEGDNGSADSAARSDHNHNNHYLEKDVNTEQDNDLFIATDEIRARDVDGLDLRDDDGNLGIVINDGGNIGIKTSNTVSYLQIGGSMGWKVTSITATTTLDATHNVIIANNSAAITLNLPQTNTCTGRIYTIKQATANSVTIDGFLVESIDGSTTYVLNAIYKYVMIVSDGTNWQIISNN